MRSGGPKSVRRCWGWGEEGLGFRVSGLGLGFGLGFRV